MVCSNCLEMFVPRWSYLSINRSCTGLSSNIFKNVVMLKGCGTMFLLHAKIFWAYCMVIKVTLNYMKEVMLDLHFDKTDFFCLHIIHGRWCDWNKCIHTHGALWCYKRHKCLQYLVSFIMLNWRISLKIH